MFKVGQSVVCVNPSLHFLIKGNIYTVVGTEGEWNGNPQILDVVPRCNPALGGGGWLKSRFRPLVSNSTKQSRQAIIDRLKPAKQPVEA